MGSSSSLSSLPLSSECGMRSAAPLIEMNWPLVLRGAAAAAAATLLVLRWAAAAAAAAAALVLVLTLLCTLALMASDCSVSVWPSPSSLLERRYLASVLRSAADTPTRESSSLMDAMAEPTARSSRSLKASKRLLALYSAESGDSFNDELVDAVREEEEEEEEAETEAAENEEDAAACSESH